MSLFDTLSKAPVPQGLTPAQALSQLQRDPRSALQAAGLDVPAGMTDPRQIVNHLLQTGQLPQARYLQALRMMGK